MQQFTLHLGFEYLLAQPDGLRPDLHNLVLAKLTFTNRSWMGWYACRYLARTLTFVDNTSRRFDMAKKLRMGIDAELMKEVQRQAHEQSRTEGEVRRRLSASC